MTGDGDSGADSGSGVWAENGLCEWSRTGEIWGRLGGGEGVETGMFAGNVGGG